MKKKKKKQNDSIALHSVDRPDWNDWYVVGCNYS